MKSVSITQARRDLSMLLESGEPVEITRRGLPFGTLRVFAKAKRDPELAAEAARGIRAIAAKCKPSKKYGATKMVRDLRDRGE